MARQGLALPTCRHALTDNGLVLDSLASSFEELVVIRVVPTY